MKTISINWIAHKAKLYIRYWIKSTLQSWLWGQVKLMAWELSLLERLNGIQWSWIQIPLRPIL